MVIAGDRPPYGERALERFANDAAQWAAWVSRVIIYRLNRHVRCIEPSILMLVTSCTTMPGPIPPHGFARQARKKQSLAPIAAWRGIPEPVIIPPALGPAQAGRHYRSPRYARLGQLEQRL